MIIRILSKISMIEDSRTPVIVVDDDIVVETLRVLKFVVELLIVIPEVNLFLVWSQKPLK